MVGLDVVGYSAQTEADAEGAALAIALLRHRSADLAARRGGRIFNTAGDSVMMEFAAAREAVHAIEDLLDGDLGRSLRIGAHLGDVAETPSGDLLGHGVNVAARLLALAEPGSALISGEVRAAMAPGKGRTMHPIGEVRLAKMQTTVNAFRIVVEETAPPTPAPVRNAPAVAIAVLPFANLSGDSEQEYFSDGISDDITTDLSKVTALTVISRNSAFTFKGQHVDLPQVARRLNATHVLEGSVRKAGNRVRITAQLIDGVNDTHLWAERYDRDLSDIFALQDEISQAIVAALKLKLLPEEEKSLRARGTDNVDAFDTFLRARSLTDQMGAANLERAIDLYRQALALDPGYREATAGLVQALRNYVNAVPERRAETLKELDAIYQQEIATAPDSWIALGTRAMQSQMRRDYLAAERLLDEASQTAPVGATRRWRSWLFEAVCRFEEAVELYRPIVREDPLSLVTSFMFQSRLDAAGRTEEAAAEYERSRDLSGDRGMVELVAFLRRFGDMALEDSARQYRRFLSARGPEMQAPVFEELGPVLDAPERARTIIAAACAGQADANVTRLVQISLLAAAFGADEVAVDGLRRAFVDLRFTPQRYLWLPVLSRTRRLPEFKAIVRDLGLYDYWRVSGTWGDFARPIGHADFEIVR